MPFHCVSCSVSYETLEDIKSHYQTEFHVYNLKRKTANLAPVSEAAFRRRKAALMARQQQTQIEKTGGVDGAVAWKCTACRKTFKSHRSYLSHTDSKKHAAAVAAGKEKQSLISAGQGAGAGPGPDGGADGAVAGSGPAIPRSALPREAASTVRVVTADDEASVLKPERLRAVPPSTCFFDGTEHEDVEANLRYMEERFAFFVPDREYCVDLAGLFKYLGQKVGLGHMCLSCNRVFPAVEGAMQHMRDASHCKIAYDADSLYEYEPFYDFSSSYASARFGGREAEVDELGELRLPDGRIVGHRDYRVYYKQSFSPADDRESVQSATRQLLLGAAAAPGSRAVTVHTGPHVHRVAPEHAAAQRAAQGQRATQRLRTALQQNQIKRKFEKCQDYQWG